MQHQHLIYLPILSETRLNFKPSACELDFVLDSLVASRAMLLEDGVACMRKHEGERKLLLNLDQGEVERVLGEVGGARWKNALSV